jgi:hypothetical protein
MESATQTNVGATGGDVEVATVEVGFAGRWAALDLMITLLPFHSFMVQRDREHWVVHARVPGCHGETLDDLVTTIERSGSDVGLTEFTCSVDGRVVKLTDFSEGAGDRVGS